MAKTPSRPNGQAASNWPSAKTPAAAKPAAAKPVEAALPADAPEFVGATPAPTQAAPTQAAPAPMTRTTARSSEQAVAEARLEERRAAARTTGIVAAVSGLVIIALVFALIVVVLNRPGAASTPPVATATTATTAPGADSTAAFQAVTTLGSGQIAPPNADAGQGWIEVKSPNAKADALIVDMHVDYQCPWCGLAEKNFGAAFDQLAERGDIIYRVHIRTFVGAMIIKNDSSFRASMAAACADTVGDFLAYSQTVFTNQPQEGVGYTDQQLSTDFATQAGITGAALSQFQACYAGGKTHDFATNMETNNWNSTTINYNVTLSSPVQATPTIFINGAQLNLGSIMQTTSPYAPTIDNSADGLLAVLNQAAGR